jgi:hypothetical protein
MRDFTYTVFDDGSGELCYTTVRQVSVWCLAFGGSRHLYHDGNQVQVTCLFQLVWLRSVLISSGGLTSKLYRCRLSLPPVDSEPTDVLFRVHGEVLLASSDILLNNTIVTALLAERGLGPKLYAVFPGGRIEEFVQSVPED